MDRGEVYLKRVTITTIVTTANLVHTDGLKRRYVKNVKGKL